MKNYQSKVLILAGFTALYFLVYFNTTAMSQDYLGVKPKAFTEGVDSQDLRRQNKDALLNSGVSSGASNTGNTATAPASAPPATNSAPADTQNAPPAATTASTPASSSNDDTELSPDLKSLMQSSDEDLHLIPLSLNQAIMAGIETNFDVLIKLQDQKAAESAVREAKGEFDPTLNISGSYEHESLPQNTEDFVATGGTPTDILDGKPRVFQERNYHYKIALDQKTSIGTQLEFKTQMDDLQNTLNETSPLSLFTPEYQSFTGMTIQQPLLRGFGTNVNEAGIRAAVLDKFIGMYDVQDQIITTISQIVQNYDQLSYLDEEITAKQVDRDLGLKLVNQKLKALERGEASSHEVNRAESALAEIIEDYSKVRNDFLTHQALLQALICSQAPNHADFRYLPKAPLRDHANINLDYATLLNRALHSRPKYLAAVANVQQQNVRLVYAKNKLWPQLDFTSTLGENGLSGSFGNSYYRQTIQQGPQWSVGFIFSMPFGNDDAEGKYGEVMAHKRQAVLNLSQVELNTSLEIQKLIETIRVNRSRLNAMQLFVKTASSSFDDEKVRQEKGLSTDLDVLRSRRDFTEAQARESAVLADLNTSYVQLDEVTGDLLQKHQIELKQ